MKSIVLLMFLLILVVFGASRFMPSDVAKNQIPFPKLLSKPTTAPTIAINIPKTCAGQVTPNTIEGPYYTEGSPKRTDLQSGVTGEKFKLTGYVFDTNCKPVAGAWVDFWQADANGEYDNTGYKLRGHQFTDSNGMYHLETIIPGLYTGRTPHIHVKVQATEVSPLVIAQLYFPNATRNAGDPIFNQATLINIENTPGGKIGTYNFIVEVKQ